MFLKNYFTLSLHRQGIQKNNDPGLNLVFCLEKKFKVLTN